MPKTVKSTVRNRAVESETSKALVLAQPFLAMILCLFLGIIFNGIWGDNQYLTIVTIVLSFITLLLAYYMWHVSRIRSDIARVISCFSIASAGAWVTASTYFGPFTRPTIDVWLLGGISLCFIWLIRNSVRTNERDDGMSVFFEEIGIPGTKFKIISRDPEKRKFRARVKMQAGKYSITDLQNAKGKLASFFHVPSNGVRIDVDPEDHSAGYVTVVGKDMLKNPIPYEDGNELNNDEVFQPIHVGTYEDGEPALFPLASDILGAAHALIQGMNGSGKSAALKVILAALSEKPDVLSWVVDTVKGEQTLNSKVRKSIDWVVDDEKTAEVLFKKMSAVIRARATHLGRLGLDKWMPGCGLTFIHFHIEEASSLLSSSEAFVQFIQAARSVGIQITGSLQRASWTSLDTTARAQFSSVLCFGVNDHADAKFALPDHIVDAGADPSIWKNNKPGYAYLTAPGLNDELMVMPLRTFLITDDQVAAQAEKYTKKELDPVTREAIGQIYHSAGLQDDNTGQVQYDEPEWPDEADALEAELNEDIMNIMKFDDSEDAFDDIPAFDKEIDNNYETLSFGEVNKLDANEARQLIKQRIQSFVSKNKYVFDAPELSDIVAKSGYSRGWIWKQLEELQNNGVLQKEGHTYTILKDVIE